MTDWADAIVARGRLGDEPFSDVISLPPESRVMQLSNATVYSYSVFFEATFITTDTVLTCTDAFADEILEAAEELNDPSTHRSFDTIEEFLASLDE
jgi:hypothetical protein